MPVQPPPGKLAGTAKVGEKGQIVIPKDMREMFRITPGDTLLLLADAQQGIAIVRKELFDHLAETILRAREREGDGDDS
jgi:AbrB family looped-hinge helix DNA binding protein